MNKFQIACKNDFVMEIDCEKGGWDFLDGLGQMYFRVVFVKLCFRRGGERVWTRNKGSGANHENNLNLKFVEFLL